MGQKITFKTSSDAGGFSLLEILVTISLSGMLLTMVASQFLSSTRLSHDEKVTMRAQEKARALLDIMSFDLRMAGSGMPLSQDTFTTTDLLLGDAPLAILTSSDSNTITFRYNDKGLRTVLTSAFTPSTSTVDFTVASNSGLSIGDTIYISDFSYRR